MHIFQPQKPKNGDYILTPERRDLAFDENFSIIGASNVDISFDVQKLFGADGGTSINPATQNETHTMNDPQLAGIIADNYANALSVTFPQ